VTSESLLEQRSSKLVIKERANKRIVIAAPHHAPAGVAQLPCPEHPDADENTGYLAWYLAEALECCVVIACNATVDPNKSCGTDYALQIAEWQPKVLVEIHKHGGRRAKHDIEISSGTAGNDKYSESLAARLETLFTAVPELTTFTVCGTFSKLYFKASGSATITDKRWIAYHIELPPKLRKQPGSLGKPPRAGYRLCDALAKALQEAHE
jgi:hypothetical protein